jgi:hypothetical protein
MDLFCFASRNRKNIDLGIEHQLWAVSTLNNVGAMTARASKAEKYLYPGALGLLYSNQDHAFTVPFIIRSKADQAKVVTDVWPEPWRLPFKIQTLGTRSRMVSAENAKDRWPVVKRRLHARGGVSAAMNLTGTTVFVPVPVSAEERDIILGDLAS